MKKWTVAMAAALALMTCGAAVGCQDTGNVEPGATKITMYLQDFEEWENTQKRKMIDDFNSIMDDGIQLEAKFFQDDAYTDAVASARENGTSPDIFMVSYGNLYGNSISNGYAEPLNGLIDEKYLDDIIDSVKPMVTVGDTYYAYPQLTEPGAMFFYRKDYFEKAGITKVPTSWAELLDTCKKVKAVMKKGQYTIGLPINSALGWATYGLQHNASGGVALTEDWSECRVDCQGYRDLCGFWYDLYSGGYVPAGNVSSRGYNDIIEGLCQDKLAMTFAGSWSMATIMNVYPDMKDLIGYAPLPTLTGEPGTTSSNGGWTYCISSAGKNKEKAARVLEWFFCEDAARTASYFEAGAYSKACVNKSVQAYLNETVPAEFSDWLNVLNDVSARGIPEPTYAWGISIAVSGMLEYAALNTGADKATLIESQISTCKTKVEQLMKIQGLNPAYAK